MFTLALVPTFQYQPMVLAILSCLVGCTIGSFHFYDLGYHLGLRDGRTFWNTWHHPRHGGPP